MANNRANHYLDAVGEQLAAAAGGRIKRPDQPAKRAEDNATADRYLDAVEKFLDQQQPTQTIVATTREESIVNNTQKNVVENRLALATINGQKRPVIVKPNGDVLLA